MMQLFSDNEQADTKLYSSREGKQSDPHICSSLLSEDTFLLQDKEVEPKSLCSRKQQVWTAEASGLCGVGCWRRG